MFQLWNYYTPPIHRNRLYAVELASVYVTPRLLSHNIILPGYNSTRLEGRKIFSPFSDAVMKFNCVLTVSHYLRYVLAHSQINFCLITFAKLSC
jgi:hypothetical protein